MRPIAPAPAPAAAPSPPRAPHRHLGPRVVHPRARRRARAPRRRARRSSPRAPTSRDFRRGGGRVARRRGASLLRGRVDPPHDSRRTRASRQLRAPRAVRAPRGRPRTAPRGSPSRLRVVLFAEARRSSAGGRGGRGGRGVVGGRGAVNPARRAAAPRPPAVGRRTRRTRRARRARRRVGLPPTPQGCDARGRKRRLRRRLRSASSVVRRLARLKSLREHDPLPTIGPPVVLFDPPRRGPCRKRAKQDFQIACQLLQIKKHHVSFQGHGPRTSAYGCHLKADAIVLDRARVRVWDARGHRGGGERRRRRRLRSVGKDSGQRLRGAAARSTSTRTTRNDWHRSLRRPSRRPGWRDRPESAAQRRQVARSARARRGRRSPTRVD